MAASRFDPTRRNTATADQPIRVLFRAHAGVPYRTASDEEKRQHGEQLNQIFGRCKASGVKLVGSFGTYGQGIDGFAHHFIFEVEDLAKVREMNSDIFGVGFLEKHSFEIGGPPRFEETWASL